MQLCAQIKVTFNDAIAENINCFEKIDRQNIPIDDFNNKKARMATNELSVTSISSTNINSTSLYSTSFDIIHLKSNDR